jgi:hypothetical protein
MQENAMYFDEVQDLTVCLKSKRLCWHQFQTCIKFVFKIDGFSWFVTRCRRKKKICSHCRADCVDVKEFTRGT